MSATVTEDRDAVALHEALSALIRVYQFRDRDAICCYDVSPAQYYALDRVSANGPLTVNSLAAALFLDKSSASRLVDGLVRKGYLIKKPHPDDSRSVLLHLTKPGRTLLERSRRDLVDERAEVLADLSRDERRAVIAAIERLADAAARRVDTRRGCCVRA